MTDRAGTFRLPNLAFLLCLLLAGPALASDPLPGDVVAPPLNSNLVMFYDEYQNDNRYGGQPGNAHGPDATKDTHLAGNYAVIRFVHDFSLAGHNAGLQFYLPYVAFLGQQRIGINNLGSALPGVLPSLGRGSLALTRSNGFAQPQFGAFFYPVANRQTGTYFMIGPWISPPLSNFNKNNDLNSAQNVWTFETEFAYRHEIFGAPDTRNLALVLWEENYFYLSNRNSALPSQVVYADDIPAIYRSLGASNPIKSSLGEAATFREQPTTEFRVYLPYTIVPASRFYISPGLFQSFGGKQTYRTASGVIDSGNRTEETQLRLVASSFITPTMQVLLAGDYDVAAHGGPYERVVELRILKEF